MNKILVCTNPFKEAERLVPYAIHLGKHFGYSLNFLHIIDTREYVWYSSYGDSHSFSGRLDHDELLEKEKNEKYDKLQELLLKHGSLIGAQPPIFNEVRIDMLEDALYDYSREPDTAFLLITDETGPGKKAYNLLTAIESSDCPVWIVPPEGTYTDVKRILFASDFKEYNKMEIKSITDLARSYHAEIVVSGLNTSMHNKHPENAPRYEDIIKDLKDNSGNAIVRNNTSSAYTDISEFATEIGADLIILQHSEKNMLREMAWANAIEKVVRENHPPILVYKDINNDD